MNKKKILAKSLIGFVLVMALMKVVGGSGFIVVLLLLLGAIVRGKPEKVLYFFLMSVVMTMCNHFLVPKGGSYGIVLRLMNFMLGGWAIVKLAGMRNSPLLKPFLLMYLYLAYMVAASQSGWCPTISNMKLLLYSFIYIGYYGVANFAINAKHRGEVEVQGVMLAFAAIFIVGSILVIPIPAISIMDLGSLVGGEMPVSLFQGITGHSQCLGPAVAILTTMVYADLLYNVRRPDKLYLTMLFCAPILLYKTSSRTAMGACIAGLMIVTYYFLKLRGVSWRWKGKVMNIACGLAFCGLVAILAVPSLREGARRFILKFDKDNAQAELSFQEVTKSRSGKWEETMASFRKSPMFGNGFQVTEGMSWIRAKDAFKHLSAPVEKGVWVSAILEEGGVCGMVLFLIFLGSVFFSLSRQKAYMGLSTFMVLVISNLGEFTIFSMTYTGGLQWAVVFSSLVLDAQRLRATHKVRLMSGVQGRMI